MGTTDRLPYYSASSAQHLEQYKKVVGRWRHSQQAIQPSTWSGAESGVKLKAKCAGHYDCFNLSTRVLSVYQWLQAR